MRQALTIPVDGVRLCGTLHEPTRPSSGTEAGNDWAFLFLDMGHAPRAGHGNLVARIGDELAEMAHPVFRFDFPGIGDSPGDVPEREEPFWRFLQKGGFTDLICGLIEELRRRFEIRGVVVGGLCGGAVASILVADRAQEQVQGLVLLEPDFALTGLHRERAEQGRVLSTKRSLTTRKRWKQELVSWRSWTRFVTGKSKYRYHLRAMLTLTTRAFGRAKGQPLPSDANLPLIEAWQHLVRSGMPILVFNARDAASDMLYQEVNKRVLPKESPLWLVEKPVEKANHTFTTPGTDDFVIREIRRWGGTVLRSRAVGTSSTS